MKFDRKTALIAAVAAALAASSTARADDWTGFFSGAWTFGGNWNDFTEPTNVDDANFTFTAIVNTFVDLDASRTVKSFFISAQAGVADYKFTRSNSAVLTVTNQLTNSAPAGDPSSTLFDGFRVSSATALLQGDSTLTLSGSATINVTGQLKLQQEANLVIGLGSISAGTLVMVADNTLVVNSGGAMIVAAGGNTNVLSGTLTLNNGGTLNQGNLLNAQGTGFVQFNRDYVVPTGRGIQAIAGGDIASNSFIDVGASGAGTMEITGAGSSINVGTASSSVSDWGAGGATTISFNNSATGDYNAGLRIGNGGTARVDVLSSASLNVDQSLRVLGQSSITIQSATLTSTGTTSIGGASTVNLQSGGALNLNGSATIDIGSTVNWTGGELNIGSGSAFNVNGGSVNNTAGGQALGSGATIRVTNAGKFDNNSFFDIANGAASGTLIVDGAGSRFTSNSSFCDWGRNAGNAATVTIQNSGVGTFAGVTMSSTGGASTLNLSSGGVLNVGSNNFNAGGTGSSARINITGGTLNNVGAANFLNGSTVSLSSGGLMLNGNATFSSGATLSMTGGALGIASGRTLAFNGGTGSVSGSYSMPDGATIAVTNGGRLDLSSFFDVANGNATGTLLVDGANSRVTTAGAVSSDWGFSPGQTATVTFSNGGAGTYSGLDLSNGGGATQLTIASGGNLNVANNLDSGGGSANVNINVTGGSLNVINSAIFRAGSTVNVAGNGVLRLGGNSTFLTGSTFLGTSSAANSGLQWADGQTLDFNGGVGTVNATQFFVLDSKTLRITNGGQFNTRSIELGQTSSGTLLLDTSGKLVVAESAFPSTIGQNASGTATFRNGGAATFETLTVGAAGQGTVNVESGGVLHADGFFTTFAGGTATINVNGGTLRTTGNSNVNGGATLNFASGTVNIGGTLGVGIVNANARVLLTPGANKVLRVGGLDIQNGGIVDLSDNAMIVDYTGATPLPAIRGFIFTGRNGGAWDGAGGINSTAAAADTRTALGLVEATDIGSPATFLGQPIDDTAILTRFVFLGDSNLDGTVNIGDFAQLASNFNLPTNNWFKGDYNYDGVTGIGDFSLLASNFNLAMMAQLPRGSAVPEPACALLFTAAAALRRRRRR